MKERIIKTVKSLFFMIILLLVLNIIYLLFMTATFAYNNDNIRVNLEKSSYYLMEEKDDPIFFDNKVVWPDYYSDSIWYSIAITDNPAANAIEKGVGLFFYLMIGEENENPKYNYYVPALYYSDSDSVMLHSYSRYWMLCIGFVRVFLSFMEVKQIRYLIWTINELLLIAVVALLIKKNWQKGIDCIKMLIPFAVSVVFRDWLLYTTSLSTGADVFTTLLGSLGILAFYEQKWFKKNSYLFFLILGSLAFAVGPMVAPLLTLGIPLILYIMVSDASDSSFSSWFTIIGDSIAWLWGYGGTIICKMIASLAFTNGQNTSESAIYYFGLDQGLSERFARIIYCFKGAFAPIQIKLPAFIVLLVILMSLIIKNGYNRYEKTLLLLFVACYPIVWVFIVVEHSMHNFVANIFSIFIYAICSVFLFSISSKKA